MIKPTTTINRTVSRGAATPAAAVVSFERGPGIVSRLGVGHPPGLARSTPASRSRHNGTACHASADMLKNGV